MNNNNRILDLLPDNPDIGDLATFIFDGTHWTPAMPFIRLSDDSIQKIEIQTFVYSIKQGPCVYELHYGRELSPPEIVRLVRELQMPLVKHESPTLFLHNWDGEPDPPWEDCIAINDAHDLYAGLVKAQILIFDTNRECDIRDLHTTYKTKSVFQRKP